MSIQSKNKGKDILDIVKIRNIVLPLCKSKNIKHAYLFGSYARGDADANSDVDIRIDKGDLKGLFAMAGFRLELKELLGKDVDVVVSDGLDDRFLLSIKKDEVVLYEE